MKELFQHERSTVAIFYWNCVEGMKNLLGKILLDSGQCRDSRFFPYGYMPDFS